MVYFLELVLVSSKPVSADFVWTKTRITAMTRWAIISCRTGIIPRVKHQCAGQAGLKRVRLRVAQGLKIHCDSTVGSNSAIQDGMPRTMFSQLSTTTGLWMLPRLNYSRRFSTPC